MTSTSKAWIKTILQRRITALNQGKETPESPTEKADLEAAIEEVDAVPTSIYPKSTVTRVRTPEPLPWKKKP